MCPHHHLVHTNVSCLRCTCLLGACHFLNRGRGRGSEGLELGNKSSDGQGGDSLPDADAHDAINPYLDYCCPLFPSISEYPFKYYYCFCCSFQNWETEQSSAGLLSWCRNYVSNSNHFILFFCSFDSVDDINDVILV